MIFAAAGVIAIVTVIVIFACYRVMGISIELQNINIKDVEKKKLVWIN